MTNRFDQPIQNEYVSLYTPIPFELLFAVGKANAERVDKSYQDLSNLFNKWSEFRSPSAVDTKRWYDLTVGAGQELVNLLATNPDLIKTAEGRSKIQSFINTRPYLELGNLQLSREGLLTRQKVNQLLMLSGKYNPLWHDVDFTNYDTSKGVFNDVSPLAYKDIRELSDPYYKQLKQGYIETKGGYDYFGNTLLDVEQVANAHLNDIVNTPEALKHMLSFMLSTGANAQQAAQWLRDEIIQSNLDRTIRPTREVNPLYAMSYKESLKTPKGGLEVLQDKPMRLTQSVAVTGLDSFNKGIVDYVNRKSGPEIQSLSKQMQEAKDTGDTVTYNILESRMLNIAKETSSYTPQKLVRSIFLDHQTGNVLTNYDVKNATNDILNTIASPLKVANVNKLLTSTVKGISQETESTPLGKKHTIDDTSGLRLVSDVFMEMAGKKLNETSALGRLSRDILSGKITNAIVISGGEFVTFPTSNNGEIQPNSNQVITIGISESQAKALGYTELELINAGANVVIGDMGKLNKSYDVAEDGETTITKKSVNRPRDVRFYLFKTLNSIPNPQDKLNAEYLDQTAWKLSMPDSDRSELFTSTQAEAYGLR